MTPAAVRSARRPISGLGTATTRRARRARAADADRARAPRLPRRLSGPIGGRARAQAAPQQIATLGERALAVVRSLPDRSLIDRLVRGRAWIPVLGVLLAGLVAMQVEILKLGTSIGRSIERSTALQSRNESLQTGVATLADDQRIERLAAGMGMAMPSPSSVAFVTANAHNAVGRALANVHAPDPANFASQLAAQIAAATMIAPAAPGTATTTGTVTTTGTATPTGTPAAPSPTASPGGTNSTGTAAQSTQTAPGTTSPTSQSPVAGPATGSGDTGQTPPTSAPGGTTAGSPTVAASGSPDTGAAAPTPASAAQSGTPSGG
jgi:cell division protein FtsL